MEVLLKLAALLASGWGMLYLAADHLMSHEFFSGACLLLIGALAVLAACIHPLELEGE